MRLKPEALLALGLLVGNEEEEVRSQVASSPQLPTPAGHPLTAMMRAPPSPHGLV